MDLQVDLLFHDCSEFYEIVHATNPLRSFCFVMLEGRMQLPWFYERIILHYASGRVVQIESVINGIVDLADNSTRFWFPLRNRSAYDPYIINNIMSKEKAQRSHSSVTVPLYLMLYDLMMVKLTTFPRFEKPPYVATRDELIPRMKLYASYDTLQSDARWVDKIIEDGWHTMESNT